MARRHITVKILKSKTDNLWYRNKIGKEYKVTDSDDRYYSVRGTYQVIYKEDCELVKE